jgi:hypothetical protein
VSCPLSSRARQRKSLRYQIDDERRDLRGGLEPNAAVAAEWPPVVDPAVEDGPRDAQWVRVTTDAAGAASVEVLADHAEREDPFARMHLGSPPSVGGSRSGASATPASGQAEPAPGGDSANGRPSLGFSVPGGRRSDPAYLYGRTGAR